MKIRNPTQVAPIAGMAAARPLPRINSAVVIGVARSGSNERVVFSPTML